MDKSKYRKNNIYLEILIFISMWILGIGLFYYLGNKALIKMEISIPLKGKLILFTFAGLIWTCIGYILVRKDEKIAAANAAIRAAVQKVLEKHP